MVGEQSVICPAVIGREDAIAIARRALERTRDGQGRTLLLSGEAGAGKSRLLRQVVEESRERGFVALQGTCFEADANQPYAPVVDLVRVFAATTSPALAAHCLAPAAAELVGLFPELRDIFPDTAPARGTDPEAERRQYFHAFAEALRALGRVQPVLLAFEDVHWSDDATLDLVLHLARQVAIVPADDHVLGVLYDCTPADMANLDVVEGVAQGHYEQQPISVETDGTVVDAIVYVGCAGRVGEWLPTTDAYLDTILEGARDNDFPEAEVERILVAAGRR